MIFSATEANGVDNLNGVVPIKSRVGWYQVPAPGTARPRGSPGCGPALKTERLHHHTMDRVGFLSHDGSGFYLTAIEKNLYTAVR